MSKHHITYQKTYVFPETSESVTCYVSDTMDGLAFALSLSHTETADTLKWTNHYEGILQIPSQVAKRTWYMYLSAYWQGDYATTISVERPLLVKE